MSNLFRNADIDKEFACYVFGFNSIINQDEDNIFHLFKSSILLKDINDLSLIEAIYDLIKYGPKCLNKHLKTIFEKHCESNKLYSTTLESWANLLNKWTESSEKIVIENVINALDGDMTSLGFILDQIINTDKKNSIFWTLFAMIWCKDYDIAKFGYTKGKEHIFYDKAIKEAENFFKSIVYKFTQNHEIVNRVCQPAYFSLLWWWISQDLPLMIKHFKQNKTKVLDLIYNLWTPNDFIPDLTPLFQLAKEHLKEKYDFIVDDKYEDRFIIQIQNYKCGNPRIMDKGKNLFKPLMQFEEGSIIDREDLINFSEEYHYEMLEGWIRIDAPSLLRLVFRAFNNDSDAIFDIVTLSAPLLRELPGGIALYKTLRYLYKKDLNKIINILPALVRIILALKVDFNLPDDELSESINKIKNIESLVELVVSILKLFIVLINQSDNHFDLNQLQQIFKNMMIALEKYEEETGTESKIFKTAEKQIKMITMILGLSSGNFEMIKELASELGVFDGKVKEFYMIFDQYKSIIFRNGVFGLPQLNSELIGTQLKQGFNIAIDQAKIALNNAINEGSAKVTDYMLKGASKLSNTALEQIQSFSKYVPGLEKKDEPNLIFANYFQRFDVDNSGFVEYDEFCELCRSMGLIMDKERTLKLFSSADRDRDNKLDLKEFQYAIVLLKLKITYKTLKKLGMTREELIWFAVMGVIFLLLMLLFIFLGMQAFSEAKGFNSVINSILPLFAGVAAAARNLNLNEAIEKVKSFVEEILSKITIN